MDKLSDYIKNLVAHGEIGFASKNAQKILSISLPILMLISKVLICLYNNSVVADSLLFRGGTALNKIYLQPAARYSEDIDFVQIRSEPIGPTINAIRASLDK